MVWKFGLIIYILLYQRKPFSYLETTKGEQKIDPNRVQLFLNTIKTRLKSGQVFFNDDPINRILKRALVFDIDERAPFEEIKQAFALLYQIYQPTRTQSSFGDPQQFNASTISQVPHFGGTPMQETRAVDLF